MILKKLDVAMFSGEVLKKNKYHQSSDQSKRTRRKEVVGTGGRRTKKNRWWQPKHVNLEKYATETGVMEEMPLVIVSSSSSSSSTSSSSSSSSSTSVSFKCHACVLLGHLEFFQFSLRHPMKESQEGVIHLPFSSSAITRLLDYVYFNELFVEPAARDREKDRERDRETMRLLEVQALCHYLMFDKLHMILTEMLCQRLSPNCVMDILCQAQQQNQRNLERECRRYVVRHYEKVISAWSSSGEVVAGVVGGGGEDLRRGTMSLGEGEGQEEGLPDGRELLVYVLLLDEGS